MKTALTVWGKWISPVFDAAQTFLIAEINDGQVQNRQLFKMETDSPLALAKLLKSEGVSTLICGAISEHPSQVLENESLRVIPFITGCTDAVLETLAKGKSIVPLFLMPGCKIRNLLCQNGKPKKRNQRQQCRKKDLM